MKRILIAGFVAMFLYGVTLSAQRRGFGTSPSPHFSHGGGFYGHSIQPLYYEPVYYPPVYYPQFYGSPFYGSLYYPTTQILTPAPQSAHGGPMIIVVQAAQPSEQRIVYIPSWMRPNPGPSLGEIARNLGARPHKHPLDKALE